MFFLAYFIIGIWLLLCSISLILVEKGEAFFHNWNRSFFLLFFLYDSLECLWSERKIELLTASFLSGILRYRNMAFIVTPVLIGLLKEVSSRGWGLFLLPSLSNNSSAFANWNSWNVCEMKRRLDFLLDISEFEIWLLFYFRLSHNWTGKMEKAPYHQGLGNLSSIPGKPCH